MTSARRQRKPGTAKRFCIASAAGLLVVLGGGLPRVEAATTERVISDRLSGLAINGVDPVAYFTDAAPLYGNGDHELSYGGVIWRFRNIGDKAAFTARPDVYMPRYGGYDPVAIARGVAVPGNPLIWAMVGQRVYLFYDEKARAAFLAKPDEAIGRADDKWPAIVSTLVQ